MNLVLIKFIIVAALLGLALCFIRTEWLRRSLKARLKTDLPEHTLFSGCVLIVFMLFTALGLTGSSLDLGVRQSAFIESDMTRVWGYEQPIRSDEWMVLTPMAIAQSQHVPRYPVVNSRLGLDGQNMLVTGMTGLPIAHVSSLAKPAIWGFFVFDLKRALAWYWWFPVFGCFLALAHVLHTLSPGRWRQSFLFSLLFVSAPYVVAWSFWPAYAVFFPALPAEDSPAAKALDAGAPEHTGGIGHRRFRPVAVSAVAGDGGLCVHCIDHRYRHTRQVVQEPYARIDIGAGTGLVSSGFSLGKLVAERTRSHRGHDEYRLSRPEKP
ncbi:hypothetical protein K5D34_11170 [Pseudomonas cichorii]|nr:hypothetical protein [Pseudomonas cichorii]MBX8492168.1 hypothetical protein [Pseudomonas cichorii]MBX8510240.1 hypothetical protein [Pseudomonas cichorii]MBX8525321.1 hypothetical protein [Pseudomonas cichorii]MBX8551238.1 hypothetical protein [Pseudomonas cichorii]MBX8586430.1 hypothetical protein [Pseudomonas cichorii]